MKVYAYKNCDSCRKAVKWLREKEIDFSEIPASSNPLGVKGVGEGGTTPAPAAIVGAIIDALKFKGVENIEMPVTSERIWRALAGSGIS